MNIYIIPTEVVCELHGEIIRNRICRRLCGRLCCRSRCGRSLSCRSLCGRLGCGSLCCGSRCCGLHIVGLLLLGVVKGTCVYSCRGIGRQVADIGAYDLGIVNKVVLRIGVILELQILYVKIYGCLPCHAPYGIEGYGYERNSSAGFAGKVKAIKVSSVALDSAAGHSVNVDIIDG